MGSKTKEKCHDIAGDTSRPEERQGGSERPRRRRFGGWGGGQKQVVMVLKIGANRLVGLCHLQSFYGPFEWNCLWHLKPFQRDAISSGPFKRSYTHSPSYGQVLSKSQMKKLNSSLNKYCLYGGDDVDKCMFRKERMVVDETGSCSLINGWHCHSKVE